MPRWSNIVLKRGFEDAALSPGRSCRSRRIIRDRQGRQNRSGSAFSRASLCDRISAASLWEIAIKNSLGREDFRVEPRLLRRALLDNGYTELPLTSEHAVNVAALPPLHKDPFDRLLIAQVLVEGITLLTADAQVARYRGSVRKV